ncbi:MAG: heme lyase CcmF/NrfE family subunit [Marinagarivorans sp.]
MIPEYGNFALIIALTLAICLSVVPMAGSFTGRVLWMSAARPLAVGQFVFTTIAFCILTYCFVVGDFSVKYVATNSNSLLPTYYKVSAVWGGHEGSLLLWALVLCAWTLAVATFSKQLPLDVLARVLSVMGVIGVGFLSFMLITSNPFTRNLPGVPNEGGDLNPLLQDFGLIIHPPMLYMGYVGFSVVFAFAIAALIGGRLDASWARWSRPWTNMAWAFLTLGIALGSWWAYYELGWGGWWFWDPVENASFMPWLVGTALIHSLAVTEKRGVFKSWTILLAIFAFSLSLLGTFLVRSGVLTSVHSFAADPARGTFVLVFLGIVVGSSLLLYAFRVPEFRALPTYTWLSRETFLLFNNIIFVIAAVCVLFGTLYPILADFIAGAKISVGPPWFNIFFAPLMSIIAVLSGIGVFLNWKKTATNKLSPLIATFGLSLLIGLCSPLFGEKYHWGAALVATLGAWVILSTLAHVVTKVRQTRSGISVGLSKLSLSYWGMVIAHIGFAWSLMGAGLATIYTEQRDLRLAYQQKVELGGYEFELKDVANTRGPNYTAETGDIQVYKNGAVYTRLHPENRQYLSGGNKMTEAAIDAGFTRDLYVALGEKLDTNAWAIRVHYKPFVRWIWLGALFMALGGTLAIIDKRYRLKVTANADKSVAQTGSMGIPRQAKESV